MLGTLRRIIQEVNTSNNLNEALSTTVTLIQEVTQADSCSIFLVDKEQNEHVLMATAGLNKGLKNKLRIKLGEGMVGMVGEREEPLNIADTIEHPKFCHYEQKTKSPFRAFLGVPIISQRELLGVLVAQKIEPSSFSEDEEAFLVTLSAQLANTVALSKLNGPIPGLSKSKKKIILDGVPSIPGVGVGKIIMVYPPADIESVADKKIKEKDIPQQIQAFRDALKAVRKEIAKLSKDMAPQLLKAEQGLFDAYLEILNSRSIKSEVIKNIEAGNWAQGAITQVFKKRTAQFAAMENEYLQERAEDIRDLAERILAHLQASEHKKPIYPKNTILVGKKITPANLAEIPEGRLAGIVTIQGSKSSHMVIMARALGIPTIIGITELPPANKLNNKKAIIDGYYGQLYVTPAEEVEREFTELIKEEEELDSSLNKIRNLPAETIDGHRISLLVNVGLPVDIGHSLRVSTDGVGLYRTEVPFMAADSFPSEEQQVTIYRQLLKVFAPRPVTMRTLDIGGDKSLPYFPIIEENPGLGWRGIRITLDHPEIFLVQIKAMLRANYTLNNLQIMLPMISSVNEIEASVKLINQAHKELIEELPDLTIPKVGAMIEVPSAVYQMSDLAARVDFFSVGTNDLTQYLLAVDRNNSRVMHLYDPLHPAVLKALQQTVDIAHAYKKPIGVCGEMAGDPTAVILLLAMGFDSISLSGNQLLRIKWLIRNFSLDRAQHLLAEVMEMDDATEIRYHLEHALEEAGLAGLIRAGK